MHFAITGKENSGNTDEEHVRTKRRAAPTSLKEVSLKGYAYVWTAKCGNLYVCNNTLSVQNHITTAELTVGYGTHEFRF